jgi:hypothetical protein
LRLLLFLSLMFCLLGCGIQERGGMETPGLAARTATAPAGPVVSPAATRDPAVPSQNPPAAGPTPTPSVFVPLPTNGLRTGSRVSLAVRPGTSPAEECISLLEFLIPAFEYRRVAGESAECVNTGVEQNLVRLVQGPGGRLYLAEVAIVALAYEVPDSGFGHSCTEPSFRFVTADGGPGNARWRTSCWTSPEPTSHTIAIWALAFDSAVERYGEFSPCWPFLLATGPGGIAKPVVCTLYF